VAVEKALSHKAPASVGQKIELTIESLAYGGDGVAKKDGFTFFVPFSAPGDRVEAKATEIHKTYGRARIEKVLESSSSRTEPVCPIFGPSTSSGQGPCGGCSWQHLTYPAQLAAKEKFLKDSLQRIGKFTEIPLKPILASPKFLDYRNKAQVPVFGNSYGFYAEGSHRVVPLPAQGCAIQPKLANEVLKLAFDSFTAAGLAAYDEKTGQGELRHLLVRTNSEGQAMLALVTRAALDEKFVRVADKLMAACPGLISVSNNVQPKPGNVILGPETNLLAGEGYFLEKIENFKFRLSVDSFFQVNTSQVKNLWETVLACRTWEGKEDVLELYSGVGTLSLPLARRAGQVLGVENVEKAVDDARVNAALNAVKNAKFHLGAAEAGFVKMPQSQVLVVDPPRKGLSPEVLKAVLARRPPEIIYVSCDPGTLARDLGELASKGGYKLESVTPLDMFPQTYHVESVSYLCLKK
jgi:23S rRNA (uracil1939-C5)-methyltransferase